MKIFTPWEILGIIALILLIVCFKKRSSVWGGLTIGIIVGIIITIIFLIRGDGFNWRIIGKGAISGTLIGFGADLIGRVGDKLRNK